MNDPEATNGCITSTATDIRWTFSVPFLSVRKDGQSR